MLDEQERLGQVHPAERIQGRVESDITLLGRSELVPCIDKRTQIVLRVILFQEVYKVCGKIAKEIESEVFQRFEGVAKC